MLKILFSIATFFLVAVTHAQERKSLEIDLFGRYDKHADYTTRFFDRSYLNDTKLWGRSFGAGLSYIHSIQKHINARIGIGYYRLGIDKVRQRVPIAGNVTATRRNIEYRHPLGIEPLFGTSQYHYDNATVTIGFDYMKPLSKGTHFVAGGELTSLYTFSQLYDIRYDNIRYRTNNDRMLGITVNTVFGVLQKFNSGKHYLTPRFIIPIYQQLRGDKVFGEDDTVKMEKWFNGAGLSIGVGKYF